MVPRDITSSMPGNAIEVLVKEGEKVTMGVPLLVLEAMKMETEIKASITGIITTVYIQKGDRITPGETLIQIKE